MNEKNFESKFSIFYSKLNESQRNYLNTIHNGIRQNPVGNFELEYYNYYLGLDESQRNYLNAIHEKTKVSLNKNIPEKKPIFKKKSLTLILIAVIIGIFIGNFFVQDNLTLTGLVTGNLPDVGDSNWGSILNNYLLQEHTSTGAHGNVTISGDLNVSGSFFVNGTNGRVGIGISNPSQRLDIFGAIKIGDAVTAEAGVIRYNGEFQAYNGTDWNAFGGSGGGSLWSSNGNNISYNFGNVGIGTSSPSEKLVVDGNINVTGNIIDSSGGIISIPSGFIGMFNSTICPTGWNEMQEAVGRYFVAINTTGNLGATVGTELSDEENRSAGIHSHADTIATDTESAHTHAPGTLALYQTPNRGIPGAGSTWNPASFNGITGDGTLVIPVGTTAAGSPHSHTIIGGVTDNVGIAGTNAPYIQVLVCVKT